MIKNQRAFLLLEYMIALSLGALLCAGIFSFFNTMQALYRRQIAITNIQNQMRFATYFLSNKIHRAGDWSCVSTSEKPTPLAVQSFDAVSAKQLFGLTIKPNTQLLQLHECIRLHDQLQYLPVMFFIADTHRVSFNKKNIDALFIQIGDYPREELVTGMIDFQLHLYPASDQKNTIQAVEINYLLSSIDDVLKHSQTYWFNGEKIIASDHALYQSGILYSVVLAQQV